MVFILFSDEIVIESVGACPPHIIVGTSAPRVVVTAPGESIRFDSEGQIIPRVAPILKLVPRQEIAKERILVTTSFPDTVEISPPSSSSVRVGLSSEEVICTGTETFPSPCPIAAHQHLEMKETRSTFESALDAIKTVIERESNKLSGEEVMKLLKMSVGEVMFNLCLRTSNN
jgi:hypothetical protein